MPMVSMTMENAGCPRMGRITARSASMPSSASKATAHGTAGSPLADYGVGGVENGWLSTGLAGVIGVLLCFALAAGLIFAIRWTRRRSANSASELQR